MTRPPADQEITLGMALFIIAMCVMFGANTVMLKVSLGGFGVFTAGAIRFLLGAAAIALWAAVTGRGFGVPRGYRRHVLALSILFTVQLGLVFFGVNRTDASRATLIMNTHPLLLLVLSHFLVAGDRMTARKAAGVLLGFAGVLFVFLEREGVASDLRTGDLQVLSGVVIWGLNTVYIKRIVRTVAAHQLVLYPMLLAAPVYATAAFLFDRPMLMSPTPFAVAALLYQALLASAFGWVTWNALMKRYGVVALHSFIFVMPITGVILGGLLLDEPVGTRNIMLALTCVVLGICVVNLRRRRPNRAFNASGTRSGS